MTRPSTGFLCRHHLKTTLVSTVMLQRSGYWGLVYEIGKTRPWASSPPSWPGLAWAVVSRHLLPDAPLRVARPCLSAEANPAHTVQVSHSSLNCGEVLL